jgi:hypothetical protein
MRYNVLYDITNPVRIPREKSAVAGDTGTTKFIAEAENLQISGGEHISANVWQRRDRDVHYPKFCCP